MYNQPQYYPQHAVRGTLSLGERVFHAVMVVITFGLWFPVYYSRKRQARRVTRYTY